MMVIECEMCGETFEHVNPRCKYCSSTCRIGGRKARARANYRKNHSSGESKCEVCCQDFSFPLSHRGQKFKYCSDSCRKVARNRSYEKYRKTHRNELNARKRMRYENNREAEIKRRVEFAKAHPELTAESNRRYRIRHKDELKAKRRLFVENNQDLIAMRKLKDRGKNYDPFAQDVYPSEVYKRSGGVCGICHELIDQTLDYPDRKSFVVDHIVPLSKGGVHSYLNVQAAHFGCNSRKRDSLSDLNLIDLIRGSWHANVS